MHRRRRDHVTYWQGVLSRLSVPGIVLVAVGALLVYEAPRVARLVFKAQAQRATVPMKIAGLVMALVGALILLD